MSNYKRIAYTILASCAFFFQTAIAEESSTCAAENKTVDCCEKATCKAPCECLPNRMYISYTMGKGIGYKRNYTTLGYFVSGSLVNRSNIVTFADLRAHCFGNSKMAFNVGLGLRYLDSCAKRVYGVNVFYDYRKKDNDFNQLGLGFESLGCLYDLRVNGYLPIGEKSETLSICRFTYPGGFFAKVKRHQDALRGIDAEIGTGLNRFMCWPPCDLYLYGAVGPYYYSNKFHHFWGGRARLVLQYTEYLSFEVRTTYDDYFRGALQGVITLSIPFPGPNSCCKTPCCDATLCCWARQPVYRNEIIATDKVRCCWKANFH